MIRLCINYYVESWHSRNEAHHNPDKKQQYSLEWTSVLEKMILKLNKNTVIKCLRNQQTNPENTSNMHLQQRNMHLIDMHKQAEEKSNNIDMRQFMTVMAGKQQYKRICMNIKSKT